MKSLNNKSILFFIGLFLNISLASSQITIGSTIPPARGAILDLKQTDAITENSNKGLLLPRVEITDLSKLKMGDNEINDTDADGNQYSKHKGLLVYNTNQDYCVAGEPILKGLYVWDGEEWQKMGSGSEHLGEGVYLFTDTRDNQQYLAREFFYNDNGTIVSAGDWMLQNLAFNPLLHPSDEYLDYAETLGYSGGNQPEKADKKWFYYAIEKKYTPPTIPALPLDWERYRFNGILYTYGAATNRSTILEFNQAQATPLGDAPGPDEVEVIGPSGIAPNKYVQGICPPGWHLPSDREWNELERALYNNPTSYSTVTEAESSLWPNIPVWNAEDGSNNYLGLVMKSYCPPQTTTIEEHTGGKSFPAYLGGFNAISVGTGVSGQLDDVGEAWFWTSSNAFNYTAFVRALSNSTDQITRYPAGTAALWNLMSVRCKKDQ